MKLPRFLHRFYAVLMGYFWLPCPICGEYFGGHEWTNWQEVPDPNSLGNELCICDACAAKRAMGYVDKQYSEEIKAINEQHREKLNMIIFDEASETTKKMFEQHAATEKQLRETLGWLASEVERDHELDRLSADSQDCAKAARRLLDKKD